MSSVICGPLAAVCEAARALAVKSAADPTPDSYAQLYSYLYDCDLHKVCWFETAEGRRCDHIQDGRGAGRHRHAGPRRAGCSGELSAGSPTSALARPQDAVLVSEDAVVRVAAIDRATNTAQRDCTALLLLDATDEDQMALAGKDV